MRADELREMTGDELLARQKECEENLVNFRLQVATGVVENNRLARESRREIARIKTILRQRELAQAKGTEES